MEETFTIYHNPNCSKSRKTLELLQSKGINPKIVSYLDKNLTKTELFEIFQKLNCQISEIIRDKDVPDEFNLNLKDKNAVMGLLQRDARYLQRPIVICGDKAVIGRPPENVLSLIK